MSSEIDSLVALLENIIQVKQGTMQDLSAGYIRLA